VIVCAILAGKASSGLVRGSGAEDLRDTKTDTSQRILPRWLVIGWDSVRTKNGRIIRGAFLL
jgi:hypothetical protein